MKRIIEKTKRGLLILGALMMPVMSAVTPLSAWAANPGTPFAIAGQVTLDGQPADGAQVMLMNNRTGAMVTDAVGPTGAAGMSGWYMFDLNSLNQPSLTGDVISLTATAGLATNTITFVYDSNNSLFSAPIINLVTPAPANYNITASAQVGGVITPSGVTAVPAGGVQSYLITADPGYNILDVLVDGQSVGAVAAYDFTLVKANHSIEARFTTGPMPTFNITSSASAGGVISPAGMTAVAQGSSQAYSFTANAGFKLVDVIVDGVSVGAVANYKFNNVAAPHIINANFAPLPSAVYMLTASAGANGSITPSGMAMPQAGTNQTYVITPIQGYFINDVLVDNKSVGAVSSYTFSNISADHTIAASFTAARPVYTVAATAQAGGVITPAGNNAVNQNSNLTLTIAADPGFQIADVLVDGQSVGAVGTYTFNQVIANHSIAATFSAIPTVKRAVVATANIGGTITPTGMTMINDGANLSLIITPDTGFQIADVLVDGVSVGAVAKYDFLNVATDHTIEANFTAIPPIVQQMIIASANAGGTITPSGMAMVNAGANQSYVIAPDAGYQIADVLVDGTSVGAVASYSFNNVAADHTISASFSPLSFNLTASAGLGGAISPTAVTTVVYGASQSYSIVPDAGYNVADVLVDGVSAGAITAYAFTNITADHTIAASFSVIPPVTRMITATAGLGGSITPSGMAMPVEGTDQNYVIAPDAGYQIADVLVDGVSVGAVAAYSFVAVAADHTIAASFSPLTYNLTSTAGLGGAISPLGATPINYGLNQTYTITPDAGYQIADVLVDGVSVGAVATYDLLNITADHTIAASFSVIPPVTRMITATAGLGGSITPSGMAMPVAGSDQNYLIAPDAGYQIADVLVDGVSVGAVAAYSFVAVAADHTIAASFSPLPTFTILATTEQNGSISPKGLNTITGGANQVFAITPTDGYSVAEVLVDDKPMGALTTYEFVNLSANHTIHATYRATSNGGGGGGGGGGGYAPIISVPVTLPLTQNKFESEKSALPKISQTDNSENRQIELPKITGTDSLKPAVLGVKRYAEGSLLQTPNKKIYLVKSGSLKHITTLKELAKYRGQKLIKVSDDVIAKPILSGPAIKEGDLIKGSDKKIYLIKNGVKTHIKTMAELKKYAGRKVISVDDSVLADY